MIRLHCEFDTEAEAIAWRDGMYRSYHPAGYGTHIRIEQRAYCKAYPGCGCGTQSGPHSCDGDRPWVAYGSRAESCD